MAFAVKENVFQFDVSVHNPKLEERKKHTAAFNTVWRCTIADVLACLFLHLKGKAIKKNRLCCIVIAIKLFHKKSNNDLTLNLIRSKER